MDPKAASPSTESSKSTVAPAAATTLSEEDTKTSPRTSQKPTNVNAKPEIFHVLNTSELYVDETEEEEEEVEEDVTPPQTIRSKFSQVASVKPVPPRAAPARFQHRKSLLAPYEWTSAKYKPHARILSRHPPPLVGSGSGAMTNISGWTRFGKTRAPHAVLLGRPPDRGLDSEGGVFYSDPTETGKGRPGAIIVSRPKQQLVGSGGVHMENLFGLTRKGRANPPRPVIISRHPPKEKIQPGPGAYGYANPPDRRIGISMKGWPEPSDECIEPSPGFYALPQLMSKGQGVSLKGRHYFATKDQSPGPIYDTRDQFDPVKGYSMTFKPFPPHEDDVLPGPSHYGLLPGDQAVKQTLKNFPACKFSAKGYDPEKKYTESNETPGPGPGAFDVSTIGRAGGPKAVITSRPKFRSEACGSNQMENLFGKTRFGPRGNKAAIIAGRYERKKKEEPGAGGLGPGAGYGVHPDKRIGITIKSRIPEIGANRKANEPGPGAYTLPGFFGRNRCSC